VIFHDATLREMARLRPSSIASLMTVKGIGARKAEDLGDVFLEAIRTHDTVMSPDPVTKS
jgi:ATP-dependent DNA helicase RecQ